MFYALSFYSAPLFTFGLTCGLHLMRGCLTPANLAASACFKAALCTECSFEVLSISEFANQLIESLSTVSKDAMKQIKMLMIHFCITDISYIILNWL